MTRLHPNDAGMLAHIVERMQRDLRYPVTLNTLTNEFPISATRLKRLFKLIYHKSFYQYYTELRLAAAANLLADRSKSIAEVSLLIGFKSTSPFCRWFRQHNGLNPVQYRNKMPTAVNSGYMHR